MSLRAWFDCVFATNAEQIIAISGFGWTEHNLCLHTFAKEFHHAFHVARHSRWSSPPNCADITLWLVGSSQADDPTTTQLGKKIANLAFTDAEGKTTHLHDLKDKKAIVIVFLSFECPVAKSYMQPLSDMASELEKQGVAFIGLTVNQEENASEVARQAKEYQASFPIFLDRKYAAAGASAANSAVNSAR